VGEPLAAVRPEAASVELDAAVRAARERLRWQRLDRRALNRVKRRLNPARRPWRIVENELYQNGMHVVIEALDGTNLCLVEVYDAGALVTIHEHRCHAVPQPTEARDA
jgi:hypothetical protein